MENTVNEVQEEAVDLQESEEATSEVEETEVESEEVATPQQTKEENRAFAEIRRAKERAEKQSQSFVDIAKSLGFDGESADDVLVKMQAHAKGTTPEVEKAIFDRDRQLETLEEENKAFKEAEYKRIVGADLAEIKKIDPNIKSIQDLGEKFITLRANGIDAVTAYNALASTTKKKAIPQMGDIKPAEQEKTYFTRDEVKSMSYEEVKKNLDKIEKSRLKWR